MRRLRPVFLCMVLAALSVHARTDPPLAPVRIDYYFEAGCPECDRVSDEVVPVLEASFPDQYELARWDVAAETNYLRLAQWMDRFGVKANEPVYMLVDERTLLAGFSAIASGLIPAVEQALRAAEAVNVPKPRPHGPPRPPEHEILTARVRGFTLAGVLTGGLVDGLNPCAIATLVFLISVLSLSHTTGRHLLAVGAAFCLASFLTYTAIGFGLLRALHAMAHFQTLRRAADAVLVAILLALAFFSFRDALRFSRSHRASDVALRLPDSLKQRIHRLLRGGLGKRAQAATAFGIGAAVTALESVCTGQVYVPTLVFVVKSGSDVRTGLVYLLLYNLMFILPLVVVILLTFHGLKLARLMKWSARNGFVGKLLLGVFFVALAAAMLALR